MIRLFALLAAMLLAGCASSPPPILTPLHPASPDAAEGARSAPRASLRTDDATRKSHALLSAARREQENWDAYGPVSGTAEDAQKSDSKPEQKHDHH